MINACIPWFGKVLKEGYGILYVKPKTRLAHRYFYELFVDEIPKGLTIDHLCRNRLCINPDHLEVVTQRENLRRGMGQASRWRNTHCIHGHEFTKANTRIRPNGTRACRKCAVRYTTQDRIKFGRRG